ncbi:MAG: 1-deoxy-D-xylulose-5-phosphate synthase [Gammaproteobacteria bacterium]|nr:1-deoxy-D-xylulose-5-phosphate synthase [Gammaproteobacteria bacterium]
MDTKEYPTLDKIEFPADLRDLPLIQVPNVCKDLRNYLLDSVSKSGGHFAAGLGVIELTVALHYVFNTPNDKLLWDVGHQSYPHKILTGRKHQIESIRTRGGLGPFPCPEESEYDCFTVGHSSTSIGAALGMNLSFQLDNRAQQAIPIIGDGGLTAGMAYEALNHLGDIRANMLIILNDNEMSISPNVGAMTNYLTRMLSGRVFSSVRESSKRLLKPMPPMWELARRTEEHVKGMFAPGTLFEEMGIRYFGPVDGHDSNSLIKTLRNIKQIEGPKILHVITKKGKGYLPAEQDPVGYHAVPTFNPNLGIKKTSAPNKKPTYTQVFSDWICDMGYRDSRLVAITPAMREGSGLVRFQKEFPNRYYDVAIAEQHAVTVGAGLAIAGHKPVVAIYSTFLQRAYDQLIHDVAVQNLPVLFAIDRAGVVGPDGKTHTGSYDLSFLRCIPNMTIMAPANECETRQMLQTGFEINGPSAIRYPRGIGPGSTVRNNFETLEIGRADQVREGKNIAILSFGSTLASALDAANQINATVINMRFVKPIDDEMIVRIANSHTLIVTVEDNVVMGGAGSAVNEVVAAQQISVKLLNLGLPDHFQEHGTREELLADAGLDSASITARINKIYPLRDCEAKSAHVVSG